MKIQKSSIVVIIKTLIKVLFRIAVLWILYIGAGSGYSDLEDPHKAVFFLRTIVLIGFIVLTFIFLFLNLIFNGKLFYKREIIYMFVGVAFFIILLVLPIWPREVINYIVIGVFILYSLYLIALIILAVREAIANYKRGRE